MVRTALVVTALVLSVALTPARAQVITYGDKDALGTGVYGISDPVEGATLTGLLPNDVTYATTAFGHGFPFSPGAGDFPGTDQIFVGSTQTGFHDGYSNELVRVNGPQVFTLDYSSQVPVGMAVTSFTLGIAADDFQFRSLGQPFTATINGTSHAALASVFNGDTFDLGGPTVLFFTIGLSPSTLLPSHVLTLAIDQGGDGGDGWAVDFLTVGLTVSAVPEPSSVLMLGAGALVLLRQVRRLGKLATQR